MTTYEQILRRVREPGQYVGEEVGALKKPAAPYCLALAFPEVYAIGMSNHGLRILYEIINQMPDWAAERVFAPLPDMAAELSGAKVFLSTLESRRALKDCDAVSFSIAGELSASTMLQMLSLGGLPPRRRERNAAAPLVIAGGHGVFNPEPLADFVDIFFIGEGEAGLPALLNLLAEWQDKPKAAQLAELAQKIPGLYIPALYPTRNIAGQTFAAPTIAAPWPVKSQVIADFNHWSNPIAPVVPVTEAVHERATLEIMRGCPGGCRFCQAGMATRPVRWRDCGDLVKQAQICQKHTGFAEIGLLSLSTSDYPEFDQLVKALDAEFAPQGVSLSLPSLRVNEELLRIPERFKTVRKTALTIAPEAGSERLRRVINKNITDADLIAGAAAAFQHGWHNLKLYFMLGLPTETDADALAIAKLAGELSAKRGKGRGPAISLSIGNFIPKPHTPFARVAMTDAATLTARQKIIRDNLNPKKVSVKFHDIALSQLEAALARGGRECGEIIYTAWQNGANLDGWSEHFKLAAWENAFSAHGQTLPCAACREFAPDVPLPWEHIACGITPEFLAREYEKAKEAQATPPCGPENCAACGVAACPWGK